MCRGYFSSQEIDAHHATEHRSTDQSRNGCGMCCFCHAQPFEITRAEKIKSTILQHSRQNAKVVEAFCHAACRLSNQCRPSIHQPPVDEFSVCPPRCPLHSPGLTCMRACTSPRAGAASTIEIATNIRSP